MINVHDDLGFLVDLGILEKLYQKKYFNNLNKNWDFLSCSNYSNF